MQSNVLILTYWSFDDGLIQAYTLPYVRIIRRLLPPSVTIHLVTLEKDPQLLQGRERAHRLGVLEGDGIQWIPMRYYPFGALAFVGWLWGLGRLVIATLRNNIAIVHCWGTPAGAIGYLLVMLTGRKLILDSYEPHAEAMVENGTWRRGGIAFRTLFALERWQTRRADAIIATNGGMKDYARRKYGVALERLLIKPACVDLERFQPKPEKDVSLLRELGLEGKRVAVYAGKFGGIYLGSEVFVFLKEAHLRWGDNFRALLLTNHSEEEIATFCAEAQLDRAVVVTRFVPHAEVPRYLALADFALTPVKPVPTKRYCTPIKDGEYWAMGLPVLIPPNISDDSEIIKRERVGSVWETLDTTGYKQSLSELDELLAMPQPELRLKIRQLAIRYRSFDIADNVYATVYGR